MTNIIYPKQFNARVTSASKPDYINASSARKKTEILLMVGWKRDDSGYRVLFMHPDFYDGAWVYLDQAYQAQLLRALSERNVS